MNPLKKQQYDLCKLRGMKDLADKIEEIVKWINQQKPISPSGENGQPEECCDKCEGITCQCKDCKEAEKENRIVRCINKNCKCHQPEECPKDCVCEKCWHDNIGKDLSKVEEKESDRSKYCHQPKESIDHEMSNGSHIIHYKGEPCEMCLDISEYLLWRRTHCA